MRNPWDLQVSSWHHLRRERPQLVAGCADFAAFVRHKLDPQRPWQFHLDTSITPQVDCVTDRHGRLIVDFIGRYEQLDRDFADVCRRIGGGTTWLPSARPSPSGVGGTEHISLTTTNARYVRLYAAARATPTLVQRSTTCSHPVENVSARLSLY